MTKTLCITEREIRESDPDWRMRLYSEDDKDNITLSERRDSGRGGLSGG